MRQQEHVPLAVRPASSEDVGAILQFFRHVRRRHVTFGEEDLAWLLQQSASFVGTRAGELAGVLVVTESVPGWGFLRAAALAEGVSMVAGLRALLSAAYTALRQRGIHTLYSVATDSWLHAALEANGFQVVDRIVTLGRTVRPVHRDAKGAHVRVAHPEDLPAVAAVDAAAFPPPWQYRENMLKVLIATGARLTVAEREHHVVGYACVQQLGEAGHIVRLAVHPHFQGQGIGSDLLAEAINYMADQGVRYCSLNTQLSNRRALQLYEHFGFRRYGRTIAVLAKQL